MTRLMVSQGAAGFLADPGVGKTSSILAGTQLLKTAGAVNRTLVLAPLRVCHDVWPDEREKWDEFHSLSMSIVCGTAPERERALKEQADLYVTNFASLDWLAQKLGWYSVERFNDKGESVGWDMRHSPARASIPPFDMLVVDESTAFKNSGTERFKLMRHLAPSFRRRYIATGTPTPNGLINLFGQIYVLDMGNALGGYISHYRSRFFIRQQVGPFDKWILQDGAEKKIYKAIDPLVIRLDAEDFIDMPKRITQIIKVRLPDKVRAQYDRLERQFFIDLEAGRVTAVNAGAMTAKLREIANGGVYLDDHSASELHDAKTEALKELVDELQGQPMIVAYEFKPDLARLLKAFPGTPYIGGGVKKTAATQAKLDWNAGRLPLLFVNPASAGHGLNLQEGGYHVCFFALSYDLENHEQLIKRVERQGQKSKRVFVHLIAATNTVDSAMLASLSMKRQDQKSLLNALREYGRKRYGH